MKLDMKETMIRIRGRVRAGAFHAVYGCVADKYVSMIIIAHYFFKVNLYCKGSVLKEYKKKYCYI